MYVSMVTLAPVTVAPSIATSIVTNFAMEISIHLCPVSTLMYPLLPGYRDSQHDNQHSNQHSNLFRQEYSHPDLTSFPPLTILPLYSRFVNPVPYQGNHQQCLAMIVTNYVSLPFKYHSHQNFIYHPVFFHNSHYSIHQSHSCQLVIDYESTTCFQHILIIAT